MACCRWLIFRASSSCVLWKFASVWIFVGTFGIRGRCHTPWDGSLGIWILIGEEKFIIKLQCWVFLCGHLPIYRTLHFGQKYRTFPLKSTPRVSSSSASSSLSLGRKVGLKLIKNGSPSTGTWLTARFSRSSCLNWSIGGS